MMLRPEHSLLAGLLAACCLTDARTGHIPNALTIGGALVGLGAQLAFEGTFGFSRGLIGWAGTMALVLVLYAVLGMGGGDAKLIAAVGAFTSLEFAVQTLFHTLALGLLVAVPVLFARKRLGAVLSRSFWSAVLLAQGEAPVPAEESPTDSRIPVALLITGGAVLTWLQPPWSAFLLGRGIHS